MTYVEEDKHLVGNYVYSCHDTDFLFKLNFMYVLRHFYIMKDL